MVDVTGEQASAFVELKRRAVVYDKVRTLHTKVTRYTISATEEYTSYASLEEAREAWEMWTEKFSPRGEFGADEFHLCSECSDLVKREMENNGIDEWAYSEQWPCATAKILGLE